jgi:glyoxylate reductase
MKVFVSRNLPEDALKGFDNSGHEVVISEFDRPLKEEELVEKVKGVDALLSLLTDRIDGDLMDAAGPQLKLVSNYAVGFDNIDVKAATDRGIVVTNTPCDEVNEAVAELTWAFIFALSRRMVEADESVKRGAYKGWEPGIFLGSQVKGKTLGIVGMGSIGSMVARRAKSFDMQVLYTKRTPDPELEKELGANYSTLENLLTQADFVSLHVPLTEETRHMINADMIEKMKRGAYLINTARGAVVHEQALVDSLREGHLGGAALDVFDNEPNVNPELINMENVILTPHIASATHESRAKMGELAVQSVLKGLAGEMPPNIVNKEVWEKRRK